jgi:hypothetical protein
MAWVERRTARYRVPVTDQLPAADVGVLPLGGPVIADKAADQRFGRLVDLGTGLVLHLGETVFDGRRQLARLFPYWGFAGGSAYRSGEGDVLINQGQDISGQQTAANDAEVHRHARGP